MAGIYDIFRMAATAVEKVPWRWRMLAGPTAGIVYESMYGNKDIPIGDRIAKGALLGTGLGLGAGIALRGAGGVASGIEMIGKAQIGSKVDKFRAKGFKSLLTPGILAIAGASIGAAVAPDGHRTQGAMIGAGLGLAALPVKKIVSGYNTLEKIPGAQTTALIAAAAIPVVASAAFGHGLPEGGGNAVYGEGSTIDYEPLSGSMRDKMYAMNATGDVVFGLNNRRH